MVTTIRTRGEAEEIMHRLSRDMPGDETLAFALLGRMVDELRAEVAALQADGPRIYFEHLARIRRVEGRLQELADDRAIVDLR